MHTHMFSFMIYRCACTCPCKWHHGLKRGRTFAIVGDLRDRGRGYRDLGVYRGRVSWGSRCRGRVVVGQNVLPTTNLFLEGLKWFKCLKGSIGLFPG